MVFSKLLLYLTKCCCVYIPPDSVSDVTITLPRLSSQDITDDTQTPHLPKQDLSSQDTPDKDIIKVSSKRLSDSEDEFVVVV